MAQPKIGQSTAGKEMHYSVGVLVKQDDKYLLIDRNVPPLGFAGVAGHIDEGEDPEEALKREVVEEVGLELKNFKKILEEEVDWNVCSKGVGIHFWYVFEGEVTGELKRNERETKSAGWYSPEEIKSLTLEPVWKYWFEKLGVI